MVRITKKKIRYANLAIGAALYAKAIPDKRVYTKGDTDAST